MADTRLTPIRLGRKIVLCFQTIFTPGRMEAAEQKDNELRKTLPPAVEPHRAYVVRKAFWSALGLVVAAVLAGLVGGWVLALLVGRPTDRIITGLQISGAGLLLWGTLFVRGWDIQTIGGVTLTERVNQWIYRFLYFVGTAVLTLSVAWQ
jgi:hypothetical protein